MAYRVEGHRLVISSSATPGDEIYGHYDHYTAEDIIRWHDEEYRNEVPLVVKLRFLEEVERMIQNETIVTHEIRPGFDPRDHFKDFGMGTELYAYAPYHMVYMYYIQARIAAVQNDTKRQNVLAQMYNDSMITFQQEYNRTHKRNQVKTPYYRHARGNW